MHTVKICQGLVAPNITSPVFWIHVVLVSKRVQVVYRFGPILHQCSLVPDHLSYPSGFHRAYVALRNKVCPQQMCKHSCIYCVSLYHSPCYCLDLERIGPSWNGTPACSKASAVFIQWFPVDSQTALHLPYWDFTRTANFRASFAVFSYDDSSSTFPRSSVTHITHFFFPMSIPMFFIIFFSPPFCIHGSRPEAAYIYQGSKPSNTVARIAPFMHKISRIMSIQGLAHYTTLGR